MRNNIRHWRAPILLVLSAGVFGACLLGSSRQCAAKPPAAKRLPTAALISADENVITTLFETKLLAGNQAKWLERNEIKRLLEEQKLDAAFGAAGGKDRLSLGKLLKADLLVLVRETDSLDKKTRVIECVVCETRQGLRLRVAAVPLDKDAEKTAAALEGIVQAGLKKAREEIKEIVAVSPLVSDDLGFQYNYLQTAYSKIIEQVLLDVSGLVVVELGEAQAIARELALSKEPALQRRQPLYVLGKFRHSGGGDEQTVAIELAVRRGEEHLAQVKAAGLSRESAAAWLREQSPRLLGAGKSNGKELSTKEEAKQLGARAHEFASVSNWEEAVALLEAGLLLDPENQDLRHDIVVAIGQQTKSAANIFRDNDKDRFTRMFNFHQRGMQHLEQYLERAGKLMSFYSSPEPDFILQFDFAFVGYAYSELGDPENIARLRQLQKERFDWFLRLAKMRARKGFLEEACLLRATWHLSDQQRLEHSVAFVEEFADAQHLDAIAVASAPRRGVLVDEPIGHAYADRLAKSRSKKVQASATAVRKALEAAPKISAPPPSTPSPPTSDEFFKPIDLDREIPSKSPYDRPYVQGCVAAGPKLDVFWTRNELFSMSEPGKLRKLYATHPKCQFIQVVWDGRYVWGTIVERGPHSLVALEPGSGEVHVFTAKDGLPIEANNALGAPFMPLTPLEPGKVCVVGAIGRVWIATATLGQDGRRTVEIVHEARQAADPEKPQQVLDPNLAFEPTFVAQIAGKDASGREGRRVLVGRNGIHTDVPGRPLVLDLDQKKVDIADFRCVAFRPEMGAQSNGSLFLFDGYKRRPAIARIDFPGKKTELLDACSQGALWCNGEGLHLIGNQMQLLPFESQKLQMLATAVPWRFGDGSPGLENVNPPDYYLMGVATSSHYGLVVITGGGPSPSMGKVFRYVPPK